MVSVFYNLTQINENINITKIIHAPDSETFLYMGLSQALTHEPCAEQITNPRHQHWSHSRTLITQMQGEGILFNCVRLTDLTCAS